MNNDRFHWLKETYRHLTLALIGSSGKAYQHIEQALECLEKLELELKNE